MQKHYNETSVNPLYQFANDIINGMGGLRDYECYEIATENFERDICVVVWALRCLANPQNKLSKTVLGLVNERFEQLEKEKIKNE